MSKLDIILKNINDAIDSYCEKMKAYVQGSFDNLSCQYFTLTKDNLKNFTQDENTKQKELGNGK